MPPEVLRTDRAVSWCAGTELVMLPQALLSAGASDAPDAAAEVWWRLVVRGRGPLDRAGWATGVGRPVPWQYHVRGEPGQRLQRGQSRCFIVVEHPRKQLRAGRARGWVGGHRASPAMSTPRSGRWKAQSPLVWPGVGTGTRRPGTSRGPDPAAKGSTW